MIKLNAILNFPQLDKGRTKPISCNYRPLLKFGDNYVSSAIIIKGCSVINAGEKVAVEIYVNSDDLVNEIFEGQIITFWEPPIKIGEIEVTTIVPSV